MLYDNRLQEMEVRFFDKNSPALPSCQQQEHGLEGVIPMVPGHDKDQNLSEGLQQSVSHSASLQQQLESAQKVSNVCKIPNHISSHDIVNLISGTKVPSIFSPRVKIKGSINADHSCQTHANTRVAIHACDETDGKALERYLMVEDLFLIVHIQPKTRGEV